MIASLTGTITRKRDERVVIEVSGVGYVVNVSTSTFMKLPKVNKAITLLTELHFSDRDGLTLYGFLDAREERLFSHLIDVPGVGPKGALTILSAASVNELEDAIAKGDAELLTRVSGIGRKKAQKILLELQERFEGIAPLTEGAAGDTVDLLDALTGMGYREQDARKVVYGLPKDLTSTEVRLREALKQLGKHT